MRTSLALASALLMVATFSHGASCSDPERPKSGPCNPDSPTDSAEKERILGIIKEATKKRIAAERLEAKFNKSRSDHAPSDEQLRKIEAYINARNIEMDLYGEAIRRTAALYHVAPRRTHQPVALSPDPDFQWTNGLDAIWNPLPHESGENGLVVVQIQDPRDKKLFHYYGATDFTPTPKDPRKEKKFAVTAPDGRTFIAIGTIELATSKEHGLGFLASVIFHEAQHFNQLSRFDCPQGAVRPCGWTKKEIDERDAYAEQNAWEKSFGLNSKDAQKFADQWNLFNDSANTTSPLTSWNLAPRDESAWEGYFNSHNLAKQYDDLLHEVARSRAKQEEIQTRDKARRSAPPPPPTPLENMSPSVAPPEEYAGSKLGKLARLACTAPDALTDELIHKEFPDGWVHHEDIGECDSGARLFVIPQTLCAREVFKTLCSQEGEPIYLERFRFLDATVGLVALPAVPAPPARRNPTPTPTPSSPDLPMDDPEKPVKEPKDPGTRHSPRPPRPGSWNDH